MVLMVMASPGRLLTFLRRGQEAIKIRLSSFILFFFLVLAVTDLTSAGGSCHVKVGVGVNCCASPPDVDGWSCWQSARWLRDDLRSRASSLCPSPGASPSTTGRRRWGRRSLANRAARRSGLLPRLQPCKLRGCMCKERACVSAPVCTRVTSPRVSSRVSTIHPSERSSPAPNMSRNRACTSSFSRGSLRSSAKFLPSLR